MAAQAKERDNARMLQRLVGTRPTIQFTNTVHRRKPRHQLSPLSQGASMKPLQSDTPHPRHAEARRAAAAQARPAPPSASPGFASSPNARASGRGQGMQSPAAFRGHPRGPSDARSTTKSSRPAVVPPLQLGNKASADTAPRPLPSSTRSKGAASRDTGPSTTPRGSARSPRIPRAESELIHASLTDLMRAKQADKAGASVGKGTTAQRMAAARAEFARATNARARRQSNGTSMFNELPTPEAILAQHAKQGEQAKQGTAGAAALLPPAEVASP